MQDLPNSISKAIAGAFGSSHGRDGVQSQQGQFQHLLSQLTPNGSAYLVGQVRDM